MLAIRYGSRNLQAICKRRMLLFQYEHITKCNMPYLNVHGTENNLCYQVSYDTFSNTLSYPTHSFFSPCFPTLSFLDKPVTPNTVFLNTDHTCNICPVTCPHITQHSTVKPAIPSLPQFTYLWWYAYDWAILILSRYGTLSPHLKYIVILSSSAREVPFETKVRIIS